MIAQRIRAIRQRMTRTERRDGRQTARDRSLTRRLYSTFERDLEAADIQGIHFYVQNGIVTLYGTVRHVLDQEVLVSLVREIAGVQGVVAHLQLVETRFQHAPPAENEAFEPPPRA